MYERGERVGFHAPAFAAAGSRVELLTLRSYSHSLPIGDAVKSSPLLKPPVSVTPDPLLKAILTC